MITRDHFALDYSGYDPTLPPPLGFIVSPRNRCLPTAGRMHRGGTFEVAPRVPRLMMDPSDPSTWQRPYKFC